MCRKVVCLKCEKFTWEGCGKHIEEVKILVSPDQWCECNRENNIVPFDKTDNIEKIYDFIKLLDDDKYMDPYIMIGNYKLRFVKASFSGNRIISNVIIDKI